MRGWAKFGSNGDERYRYALGRSWSDGERRLLWVMLNPSTADGMLNDQTLRRIVHYSQREGYDELVAVNLYAYRATKPEDLVAAHRAGTDVVGPENQEHVATCLDAADAVVFAWGATLATVKRAGAEPLDVHDLLAQRWLGAEPQCLGLTAGGYPRHPSRLSNDHPLTTWSPS